MGLEQVRKQQDIFSILLPKFTFKHRPIKLFEAFAGIGCQAMALKRLDIEYESVGISEIDKYAIMSYMAIHGETKNYGDICKMDQIPQCDIFTWSFPCTDLSKAGKRKGMTENTRSGLVYEVLRLVKNSQDKPIVMIMENVPDLVQQKFYREFHEIMNELERYGYSNYVQRLNAKNYGVAQNRDRVFMVSILGNYSYSFPNPIKLEKRLKDYLEDEVDEKYYLNKNNYGSYFGNAINKDLKDVYDREKAIVNSDIAYTVITKNDRRVGDCTFVVDGLDKEITAKEYLEKIAIPEATKKGYSLAKDGDGVYINRPHQKRGVVQKGMIQTLKTSGEDIGVVVKGNYSPSNHNASRIVDDEGLAPTVKENHGTVTAIEVVVNGFYEKAIKTARKNKIDPGDTISAYNESVDKSGCSPTVTTRPEGKKTAILPVTNDLRIRKLTPKECWRLMGIDDEDFEKAQKVVSNSQLYRQAGNGIVVDVFAKILEGLF